MDDLSHYNGRPPMPAAGFSCLCFRKYAQSSIGRGIINAIRLPRHSALHDS